MIWVQAVLQWLHVFFAIFWFGAVLTIDFLLVPTVQGVSPQVQQAFGGAFGQRAPKIITPVACTKVLTVSELFGFALILVFMIAMRFGY